MSLTRCLLSAILLSLPSALHAQIDAWSFTGPSFTVSPADMQAAAAKIPVEKFSDVTVFYEEEHDVIDGDGRTTSTHRLVYRIETRAGMEGWSQIGANWQPWHQQQPILQARVIQPDGKAALLDAKTLTDSPASEKEGDTFSDARIYKGPLPALSVGAIVEEEVVTTDTQPFFNGGVILRNYFRRYQPVIRSRFLVEAPATMPLQYHMQNLPDVVVKKDKMQNTQSILFDQGHIDASVNSDIDLSTHHPLYPFAEVTTAPSWEAVATAYSALAEPQIHPDQVKDLLPPSVAGDRMATIQAIVSVLQQQVRYTGVEFGQAQLQPRTAAEVLQRHYGDCKDKAAFLVAMLRAADIPAHLALLFADTGADVTPDLPGIGRFNHAIVYIPPAKPKDDALWVDATAEFYKVGSLPYMDKGRLALIIAPGTQELTLTPVPTPEDNSLTETREFFLAEYGPAHITETSLTTGAIDAAYRSSYGGAETEAMKKDLEGYARSGYLAKALTSIQRGDGKDFTRPFSLTLDMASAKRGTTDISDAAMYLYPSGIVNRLPNWFSVDPSPAGVKPTEQEQADHTKAVLQRSADYDVQPFVTERIYRIHIPNGFVLRALPEGKSVDMGPAHFSMQFKLESPTVIVGTLRFTTGKAQYTADEVLALRTAVLAAQKEDGVYVNFDQIGAKAIAAGHIREGMASDQALIDAHPKEALHHVRMAYALLGAGMGEKARSEATTATVLDPSSALAYKTLGWICLFNAIGVQYGNGFDLNCSIEAYKKAKSLDPDDTETRFNLAITEEYNAEGERYAKGAHLDDAVAEYKELNAIDEQFAENNVDNLLFALLYDHQYKQLLDKLATLPSSVTRTSLTIAATIASSTVADGVERASQLSSDISQRAQALQGAATQLEALGLYAQAADVLSAGASGKDDAATVARQVDLFHNLKPYQLGPVDYNDPRSVVQHLFIDIIIGNHTPDEITQYFARHAYDDHSWKQNLEKIDETKGLLHTMALQDSMTASVLADVIFQNLHITSTGSEANGYIVTLQSFGSDPDSYFVFREDGKLKVVAEGTDIQPVGRYALYLLQQKNEAGARALLDWKRDHVHRGGGDDPLEGSSFARLWTSGESSGADAITLAAASLLIYDQAIGGLLPAVTAARDKATSDDLRATLDLVLAGGYYHLNDGPNSLLAAQQLLKMYPDSLTAISFCGDGYRLTQNWAPWKSMITSHLAKHPADADLQRQLARESEAEGNFTAYRAAVHVLMDNGKAEENDYNGYAWSALFDNHVDEDTLSMARQGVLMTKSQSFAVLHTLAALYAADGKTEEARQVLKQAMEAGNMPQPDEEVWYVLGSVYEQYGVTDAAIAAYKKLEKPDGPIYPTETWVLAQKRLQALHAN